MINVIILGFLALVGISLVYFLLAKKDKSETPAPQIDPLHKNPHPVKKEEPPVLIKQTESSPDDQSQLLFPNAIIENTETRKKKKERAEDNEEKNEHEEETEHEDEETDSDEEKSEEENNEHEDIDKDEEDGDESEGAEEDGEHSENEEPEKNNEHDNAEEIEAKEDEETDTEKNETEANETEVEEHEIEAHDEEKHEIEHSAEHIEPAEHESSEARIEHALSAHPPEHAPALEHSHAAPHTEAAWHTKSVEYPESLIQTHWLFREKNITIKTQNMRARLEKIMEAAKKLNNFIALQDKTDHLVIQLKNENELIIYPHEIAVNEVTPDTISACETLLAAMDWSEFLENKTHPNVKPSEEKSSPSLEEIVEPDEPEEPEERL